MLNLIKGLVAEKNPNLITREIWASSLLSRIRHDKMVSVSKIDRISYVKLFPM